MYKRTTCKAALVLLALSVTSQTGLTQERVQANEQQVEIISVIGSRVVGRSVENLSVPGDILSAQALLNTGQTEVARMLQAIALSFNFSSSSMNDGTDALRPATLRGLGRVQTLVLINGKRRHQASLILPLVAVVPAQV